MAQDPVQSRITAFWSTVARDYEAHEGNVPAPDSAERTAWVDAMRGLLPHAPADVLDIGTGTGFLAIIAAELGHRVTGIDLAEPMLAEAQTAAAAAALEIRFQVDDAVAPSLPNGTFDAIVCRHVLWTLREPLKAFGNWRDLLRAGGRVVAIDSYWFKADTGEAADGEPAEPGLFESHYTPETRAALPGMSFSEPGETVELFERAGFARVLVSDLAPVHALAKAPPSDEPWHVISAFRDQ